MTHDSNPAKTSEFFAAQIKEERRQWRWVDRELPKIAARIASNTTHIARQGSGIPFETILAGLATELEQYR